MKLLTWNLRYATEADGEHAWRHRQVGVCARLMQLDCDILAFQEVLPEQRQALDSALAEHHGYARGRDEDGGGEQCPIYFRKQRWRCLEARTVWLSDSPDQPGSRVWNDLNPGGQGPPWLPRIVTMVRLEPLSSGPCLFVMNTHWDYQSARARWLSARRIAELATEARRRGDGVVVLGDLNAEEDDASLAELPGRNAFRVCRPSGAPPPTYHGYSGVTAADAMHIDYIFLDGLPCQSCEVLVEPGPRYLSDHFAVLCQVGGEILS